MSSVTFTKELFDKLLLASNQSDSLNEQGTKLIGHAPQIAPKAYQHVVYKPLESSEIANLRAKLGHQLPTQLQTLFEFANGMMIFLGSIRVLGYVPIESQVEITAHTYPSDIVLPNVSARIRGLSDSELVIGWYKKDSSYAIVGADGTVTRYDTFGNGEVVQSWPDIANWLLAEADRLNSENGIAGVF